jgi:ribosomal protein S18 acetylase RimI-like enzyme
MPDIPNLPAAPLVMRQTHLIRSGRSADARLLAVLATQVWLHTYATDGITADIADYVLAELTPAKYRAMLDDPDCHLIVAEQDHSLVGFAVVRFAVPCPADTTSSIELQTLYVQEHATGRGIGKALLVAAQASARELSNSAVWLTVNANNTRAIAFYAHQGYSKVGTSIFVLGAVSHENHVFVGRPI